MEPTLGDTTPATTSDDGTKVSGGVTLGSRCPVIDKALTEADPKFVNKDMQEIHNHWQNCRQQWLKTKNEGDDARGNMEYAQIPTDHRHREYLKSKILRSTRGPYREFENYHSLQEVIELYEEIWFDESSDYF
mmetsp:Transcript_9742/g.9576  ORF Transcript_9742/g.9576 Transcript_9742/m.9576 type:complete len:133 (-) Transcript_9742:7-405(-)